MFGNSKIKEIKDRHRLEEFLPLHYGIDLKKAGMDSLEAKCPFNPEDKTPSFRVTPSKQLYNCFCGKCSSSGGDIITFESKINAIDKREAIKRLSNGHYQGSVRPQPAISNPIKAQTTSQKLHLLNDVCRILSTSFSNHQGVQDYCLYRGITNKEIWRNFHFGYSDGKGLKTIVEQNQESVAEFQALGLLNENKNESFYRCVTIPIQSERGDIVGLYGRSIDLDQKRQMYLKGERRGVFNGITAKNYKTLIICESVIDALSWVQCDFSNVISLFGTNSWTRDLQSFIENHPFEELVLNFDNDEAGQKATETIKEKTKSIVSRISCIQLPDGIKDPNDFLCNGGTKEDFQKLLDQRVSLLDHPKEKPQATGGRVEPVGITKDTVLFKIDHLAYEVRPSRSKSFDSLKAVITAFNDEHRYNDFVNLYSARLRSTFSNAVAQRLFVQSAKVEDDLYQIINYLEYARLKEIEDRHKTEQEIISLTESERKDALTFLQRKDLLKAILKDVKTIGYVGQEREVATLYISYISHMLDSQIHISIQSSSSSGKSDMMSKVASLLPKVKIYSRMSSQALYYGSNLDGVIILDEKSAVDDAGALALRSLMSRGELTLAVVQRDAITGQTKTEHVSIKASCCIWDSDTQNSDDNKSRVQTIFADESIEQTGRIHESQLQSFSPAGWNKKANTEAIKKKHHHVHQLLKPLKVEIPFAKYIKHPKFSTRSRRDFPRLLNLLSCVALLHQYQRTIKKTEEGIEYITATVNDYEILYWMVNESIKASYAPISKESSMLLSLIDEKVQVYSAKEKVSWEEYNFSRRDIAEWSRWSEWKWRRCIKELVSLEILNTVPTQGHRYRYKQALRSIDLQDEGNQITSPDDLKKVYQESSN